MSQGDQNVANADGATFRADLNSQLEALVTNSSGASAPSTTWPYMWWADTTNGLLKQRNAANSAWITKGTLADEYFGIPASAISYSPGSPALLAATNVQEAIDEIAAEEKPCFFAHRNGTNQSAIASATYTKINITNEDIDIGGYYDTTNFRWVPPSGKCRITVSLYWDAVNLVDASQMIAAIYKNGAIERGGISLTSGTGSGLIASVTAIVDANGTDYFEAYGYAGGAGAKQVNGNKVFTFFCGEQI